MEITDKNLIFTSASGYREKTEYLIIHHTAGNASTETVESVHEEHLANGWAGIGYHFFISKDGTIYRGRPENWIGSHTLGYNDKSIGISLSGNFEKEKPSDVQILALIKLVDYLKNKYSIPDNKIMGHRDFDSTACPGANLYKRLGEIKTGDSTIINPDEIEGKIFAHDKKLGIVLNGESYNIDSELIKLILTNTISKSKIKEVSVFMHNGKIGIVLNNELYRISFPEINFTLKKDLI